MISIKLSSKFDHFESESLIKQQQACTNVLVIPLPTNLNFLHTLVVYYTIYNAARYFLWFTHSKKNRLSPHGMSPNHPNESLIYIRLTFNKLKWSLNIRYVIYLKIFITDFSCNINKRRFEMLFAASFFFSSNLNTRLLKKFTNT